MSLIRPTSAAAAPLDNSRPTPGWPPGPVPGPPGVRLGLGHLARLDADFLGYTTELARQHGDCVHYRVGLVPTYQFTHPDQIQEILVTKSKSFRKTDRLKHVLGRVLGNSLLLNEGESWARQRALLQPAFHPRRLPDYAGTIVDHVDALLDRHVDREFDISVAFNRMTLVTTAEVLFGADLSGVADRFVAEVATLQKLVYPDFTARSNVRAGASRSLRRPQPAAFSESIEFLRSVIAGLLDERRHEAGHRNDMLDALIAANGPGDDTHAQQAQDEVMIMLAGGAGTTATALTWAAYLLAKHPEAQRRVCEEVDRVLGGRKPRADDMPRLAYTQMVFEEAMRLFPPAYTTSRQATRAVDIGGHRLPAGAHIHLIPFITHRDARWFDEPLEFRPERFSSESRDSIHRGAFIPFGAGPRACIGGGLALLTGVLGLATIFRRSGLRIASDQGEPELEPKISLHPKNGIRLRFTARDGATR